MLSSSRTRPAALAAAVAAMAAGILLAVLHGDLGGPGDEIFYYEQAARLIPFEHHYYGPGYMVALRAVHDLLGVEWFTAGKVLSLVSTAAIIGLTFILLARVLDRSFAWAALALACASPVLVSQSYSSLTVTFGTACVLAAVVATPSRISTRWWPWVGAGLVFGLAALTRFQALGFLLGALVAILLAGGVPLRTRVACAFLHALGAAVPLMAWRGFLLWRQGFVPENYNFVHLTVALGRFARFSRLDALVTEYGGTLGVLTSDWTTPFRIAAYGAIQLLRFPVAIAPALLAVGTVLAAGGAVVIARDRRRHAPWLGAFTIGLFLTGIGSRGWTHYYLPFVPFLALLAGLALQRLVDRGRPGLAGLLWIASLASLLLVTPRQARLDLERSDWVEQSRARERIEARRTGRTVVASSAASFRYGTTLPFVDLDAALAGADTAGLVDRLRKARVTDLLILERHTLWEHPGLAGLLDDDASGVPAGLVLDTLWTSPARLGLYRVLPASP